MQRGSQESMPGAVDRIQSRRRVRVERAICLRANGRYVVRVMLDDKPRFRIVGKDLELARAQRLSWCGQPKSELSWRRHGCCWRPSRASEI
jgi:hypothetical protein